MLPEKWETPEQTPHRSNKTKISHGIPEGMKRKNIMQSPEDLCHIIDRKKCREKSIKHHTEF